MIDLVFFRLLALFACFGFAALSDYKTGEVPDKISLFLIGFGIFLDALTGQWDFIAIGTSLLLIGILVNKLGWLGGADGKLLSGLGFTLPFFGQGIFGLDVWVFGSIIFFLFSFSSFLIKLALKEDVGLMEMLSKKGRFAPSLFAGLAFATLLRMV